jgi:DNA-binding response OmpR family regulator
MELKNAKIGVLVNDPTLRKTLSDLLWKNGAVVYATYDDEEMEQFIRIFNIRLVMVEVGAEMDEGFGLN